MKLQGPTQPLGPGGEFDRIRAIWRRLGETTGRGDDCAVIALDGRQIALSSDLSVQDVHFRTGWLSPVEIGWRAAAAALSDLAAVAATPRGLLVSLGVPGEWPEETVGDVMEGVKEAARASGAEVWGGDLVRSDRVIVDVMVVGELTGPPVWRAGASPGDGLWVTGRLGGPAAALRAWRRGEEPDASARERFARPVPRVAEAVWLQAHDARALIDLSDGLVPDAAHLAIASAVQCALQAELVPVHPGTADPLDAVRGGEEYELLVALPSSFHGGDEFAERFGMPLTRIGSVEAGEGVVVTMNGERLEVQDGFRHFPV